MDEPFELFWQTVGRMAALITILFALSRAANSFQKNSIWSTFYKFPLRSGSCYLFCLIASALATP